MMDQQQEPPVRTTAGEAGGEAVAIALNAVPVVGGVLAGIAGGIIERRQNRRLNQFLIALAGDVERLRDRINADFLRTEQFQDLAEDVFSRAAETRQQGKLDAFRAIFLNTIASDRPSYGEAAEIVALVDRWQARHVVVLHVLADPLSVDQRMGNVVGNGGGIATSISQILGQLLPDWDDDQIDRTWQDLYDDQIHRTPGTKVMMTDQSIRHLQNRLTEFGKKVASYISETSLNISG